MNHKIRSFEELWGRSHGSCFQGDHNVREMGGWNSVKTQTPKMQTPSCCCCLEVSLGWASEKLYCRDWELYSAPMSASVVTVCCQNSKGCVCVCVCVWESDVSVFLLKGLLGGHWGLLCRYSLQEACLDGPGRWKTPRQAMAMGLAEQEGETRPCAPEAGSLIGRTTTLHGSSAGPARQRPSKGWQAWRTVLLCITTCFFCQINIFLRNPPLLSRQQKKTYL